MKIAVETGQICLFDLQMDVKPKEEFNITDEEITEVLLNRYKKTIYLHFINEPYNNALFLKDQYGIGGEHGYVLKAYRWSDVDYDSNGLRITKEEGSKKAEITLNWSQVARRIEKLIKEDRYLTKEEKIKYELYENFKIDSEDIERVLMFKHGIGSVKKRIKVYKNFISNGYKAICSEEFLKETYGTSGSIRGKTSKGIRYSDNYKENGIEIEKGEIKLFMPWLSINIELHKLIKNNIFLTDEEKKKYGLVKESSVSNKPKEENTEIDKKVTEVASKSTEMDIKLKKGQAVKVCAYGKERLGEVWRLQSNGCISVYFKDTNSVGAYPRKFIKAVKKLCEIV